MQRTPPRLSSDPQRGLSAQDARYALPSVEIRPLPQTFWYPLVNINGAKAYTPNRVYLAPLKGVVDDFRVGVALFGLGCGAGFSVGHAIYRASFGAGIGLQLRRVWRQWFDGAKVVEGGDTDVGVVLSRTEQYFFAAVSDEPTPNSYVLAYENATAAYGLYYDYPVTRAQDFPDVIDGNQISRDAEFVIAGYCFPTSFTAALSNPGFNINLVF